MMGSVRPGMAAKIAEADSKLLDEEARLAALQRYRIVDTPREESFDKITALVRDVLQVPSMAVNHLPTAYPDFAGNGGTEERQFRQAAPSSQQSEGNISGLGPDGEVRTIAGVEEELIRFALRFYRGQMSEVARRLGIGRSTLYRKLKDYGIDPDDPLKTRELERT